MGVQLIILAGGKSSRMGTNKALLKIDGKTVVERIYDSLKSIVSDCLIVTNQPEHFSFLQCPHVKDEYLGKGPLAGIQAGLKASKHETNIIVACDMPFVSEDVAKIFVELCKDFDAVVPNINGKLHPLFAVYKKSINPVVTDCLLKGNLRMKDLLKQINVLEVNENDIDNSELNHQTFFNMNDPEDYQYVIRK